MRGGSLDELWQFVNIREEELALVLAWLVQALCPTGPYPILCLYGQQGSAKSTTTRVLRTLIDPCTDLSRAEPRDKGIWRLRQTQLVPRLRQYFTHFARPERRLLSIINRRQPWEAIELYQCG